ncbi:VOC family protein [Streptomyces nondiastaticus]|uniref:VOC family protein n=1 Tax=Streptomyces nondiastaticus TaxID=3154512 RepID=A0ABW6TR11_9ACTN
MKNTLDGFSMAVPDVDAAADLFRTVFGAELLSADGSDTLVDDHGAPARSVLLQLDPQTRLRLFAYEATAGAPFDASVVDIGTAHFCFRTGDIEQAAEFLAQCPGIRILGEVMEIPEGALRHHKWVYFRFPWGAYGELQEWPETPSAEAAELFHGQVPVTASPVPTLMGIDHVGYSVRDLDAAVALLTDCLGGRRVLGSVISTGKELMDRQFETPVPALSKMAMVRIGEHTNIELFEHVVDEVRRTGDRLAVGASRMVFRSDDPAGSGAELSRRFGFSEAATGTGAGAGAGVGGTGVLLTAGSGLDVEFTA